MSIKEFKDFLRAFSFALRAVIYFFCLSSILFYPRHQDALLYMALSFLRERKHTNTHLESALSMSFPVLSMRLSKYKAPRINS